MKITQAEWDQLAAAQRRAKQALYELETLLTNIGWDHHKARNQAEVKFIFDQLLPLVDDSAFQLGRLQLEVQDEWVGGDRWRPREPLCVPMPRRYLDEPKGDR